MSLAKYIPMETERLILRSFEMRDAEDVFREIYSDFDVLKYYAGKTEWSLDDVRENLAYKIQHCKSDDFGCLAVITKDKDEFVGQVALSAYVNQWNRFEGDPDPRFNQVEVELSFAFGRQFWGNGYATEASRAMIDYAFKVLKLPRLIGGANIPNERSKKLQERLGYRIVKDARPKASSFCTVLENPF